MYTSFLIIMPIVNTDENNIEDLNLVGLLFSPSCKWSRNTSWPIWMWNHADRPDTLPERLPNKERKIFVIQKCITIVGLLCVVCFITSSDAMMLQHWPTEVMTFSGFFSSASQDDGTDQDSQKPRQALVVIMKETQSGIVTRLVWPM